MGRRSFMDTICCNFCMVLPMFLRLVLANSLFSLRDIDLTSFDTWDSCLPGDTWYCVILWVLRVLGQSLKSERIFFIRVFLWLLHNTDKPQKGRNGCLWLQSRSVLSSFGVVLMSCRVNFHVVRSTLQYSACRI